MEIKDVVARIRYFRDKKKISARALSYMIDKNQAYINKLESGQYEPSMQIILDICEALEIKPEEFFYENYKNYKIDMENLEIIKNLPYEKKIAIRELLKK